MLTLSELLIEYKDVTKDPTTENVARGKRRISQLHKRICAMIDHSYLRRAYYFDSVANTYEYVIPKNTRKVESLVAMVGDTTYPLTEIITSKEFDVRRQGDDVTSDTPMFYNVYDGKVRVFPTPATTAIEFKMSRLIRPKEQTQEDYTTGHVLTLTNGTKAVVGNGTAWTAAMIGSYLIINDQAYEIASHTDNTHITLAENYQDTSIATDTDYVIGDIPLVPEDWHDILWVVPALHYFAFIKEDTKMSGHLKAEYADLLNKLEEATRSDTTENVMLPKRKYGYYHGLFNRDLEVTE